MLTRLRGLRVRGASSSPHPGALRPTSETIHACVCLASRRQSPARLPLSFSLDSAPAHGSSCAARCDAASAAGHAAGRRRPICCRKTGRTSSGAASPAQPPSLLACAAILSALRAVWTLGRRRQNLPWYLAPASVVDSADVCTPTFLHPKCVHRGWAKALSLPTATKDRRIRTCTSGGLRVQHRM